jgi:hypothetical protein
VLGGVGPAVKLPILAARDDPDLPCVGIFSDIGISVRRDDYDPDDIVGLVPDLVSATTPTRQGDNVPFAELSFAVVQTHNRCSTKDDEQLVAAVVEVVDELRTTGLELPQGCAEPSTTLGTNESASANASPVWNRFPDIARVVGHGLRRT